MKIVVDVIVKFLSSSPACDDGRVGGSHAIRIPHSLPAKAGIQSLFYLRISGGKTLVFVASDVGADFSVGFRVGFSIVVSALTRVVLHRFFQFFPIPLD